MYIAFIFHVQATHWFIIWKSQLEFFTNIHSFYVLFTGGMLTVLCWYYIWHMKCLGKATESSVWLHCELDGFGFDALYLTARKHMWANEAVVLVLALPCYEGNSGQAWKNDPFLVTEFVHLYFHECISSFYWWISKGQERSTIITGIFVEPQERFLVNCFITILLHT